MAMLEVKDLEVYYGMIQAIKGISFEVNKGEVIALIGARIVKQLISLPIYAAATYFLLKMLEKTPVVKTFFVSSKENTADK